MKGFRDFILRGNVIDLAVAVVIGAAFTAIVSSIVTNIITPLIGALFDASSLTKALVLTIPTASGRQAHLMFGAFLASVINFVIVAAVVYFAFVLPVNALMKRAFARRKAEAAAAKHDIPPTQTELLTQIRDLLGGDPSAEGDHTLAARHVAE